ncbi:MAG TPA: MBL fold metallo-hydrolase RNA specificity domain-containing protein, partial [Chthoniobacterales bacterium]
MIQVRYERGVYLPDNDIWLDPWEAKSFAFVSHAHSDHIAPHREIIMSERTARLMQARMPGERSEHILEFGCLTSLRGANVMLLPAGHIFGSAQFYIENDNGSLLYTGDFKLRPGKSAEAAEWREAETLIMETTFGLPRYKFPPSEQIVGEIVNFCREALEDKAVPVLLGYSLGKAQEILCALSDAGLHPMLHGSVFRMTRIYEQFGQSFCQYERYAPDELEGKVLVCPPSANRSRMLEKIPKKRVAMISGWAVDPNAKYRYQCDAAFPLSDHADYTDLLRYVELVRPKRVLTLHGFAAEFARDLRDRGIEAWALSQQNQLELTLGKTTFSEIAVAPAKTGDIESEFAQFAELGERIAATPAKLEKVRFLAEYLHSLGDEQLPIAARYLTGKAFAQSDPRTVQAGWAVIFRAILAATKLTDSEMHRIAGAHGDAGKSAFEALENRTAPEPFSLTESKEFFDALQRARGP